MSFMDSRQKSTSELDVNTNALPVPGSQQSSTRQLPFSANSVLSQASDYRGTPVSTRQLSNTPEVSPPVSDPGLSPTTTQALLNPLPAVTRELSETQTDALASLPARTTTTLRQPVLIRGTGKKSASPRPPQGRRLVVHAAVTAVLALVVLSALFAVLPVSGGTTHNSIFKLITGSNASSAGQMNIINTKSNNTGLIAQQAATATAVTQDGFDPGGGKTFAGVPTAPPSMNSGTNSGTTVTSNGTAIGDGTGGPGRFFYGQCTYWANVRYHALTGHYVPWLGNAYQWLAGAYNYGWDVSSKPVVPSIIVLQPGVQGAGGYGHVAVVESINPDGSVVTSNFNWAGNWGVETFVTFTPGPGVAFVYHP